MAWSNVMTTIFTQGITKKMRCSLFQAVWAAEQWNWHSLSSQLQTHHLSQCTVTGRGDKPWETACRRAIIQEHVVVTPVTQGYCNMKPSSSIEGHFISIALVTYPWTGLSGVMWNNKSAVKACREEFTNIRLDHSGTSLSGSYKERLREREANEEKY